MLVLFYWFCQQLLTAARNKILEKQRRHALGIQQGKGGMEDRVLSL